MKQHNSQIYSEVLHSGNWAMIRYVCWLIDTPGYFSVMFDKMIDDIGSAESSGLAEQYPEEHKLLMHHINYDPELLELQKKLQIEG